jgi:hypothetical protein
VVLLNDEQLDFTTDGGLFFQAGLPNEAVWVSGRVFQSQRVEVGSNDEVVRVELNAGTWLVVHPDARGDERISRLSLEDCDPPRAPGEGQRGSLLWHDGWWFGGLSAGSCRLVLDSGDLKGTAHVDLPAAGAVSVALHLTPSGRPPEHFTGIPLIRGQQPTRHR